MIINTKFNPGDSVYALQAGQISGGPVKINKVIVIISYQYSVHIAYETDRGTDYRVNESDLFTTREEAATEWIRRQGIDTKDLK